MVDKRQQGIRRGIVRRSFLKTAVSSGALVGMLPGMSRFGKGARNSEFDFSILDGKPSFDKGGELGAFIWREGSRVKVRFNGNFDEGRVFDFSFKTNKEFKNLTLSNWNEVDMINSSESVIEGRNRVRPASDGFGFDLEFDQSTTLDVDIKLSDEAVEGNQQAVINAETVDQPGKLYFGADRTTPDSVPVTFSGDMPPADPPDEKLDKLIEDKRDIAERITENSRTIIQDTTLVNPTLVDINKSVESGELDESTAENAVKRLLGGEKITDTTLAACGPGQSEYQNKTMNLSKLTARAAVIPAVELIFLGVVIVKIGRTIPSIKPLVDDAARKVARLVSNYVGMFSPRLERYIQKRAKNVGLAIFESAETATKAGTQPITEERYREIVNTESAILLENSAQVGTV